MTPEERIANLEQAFIAIKELTLNMDKRMDRFDERLGSLLEAQKQTEAHLSALAVIVQELGQVQKLRDAKLVDTDARLNKLIEIVDRFISGSRTGGNP
jgi:hypothetical protein